MSASQQPAPPPFPDIVRWLEDIVADLGELAVAFGLTRSAEGLALCAKVLDDHPAEALIGFSAPPEWDAIVVVTEGRDVGARHRSVRIALGLDTIDTQVALVRDLTTGQVTEPRGPAVGRLADVCARVLGQATPTPPIAIHQLFHHVWLDRIMVRLLADPEREASWPALLSEHPAACLVEPNASPAAVGRAAADLATMVDWADLRRFGLDGSLGAGPGLAEWFDDGSWCRWVLGQLPAVADLVADLAVALPTRPAHNVIQTITVPAEAGRCGEDS